MNAYVLGLVLASFYCKSARALFIICCHSFAATCRVHLRASSCASTHIFLFSTTDLHPWFCAVCFYISHFLRIILTRRFHSHNVRVRAPRNYIHRLLQLYTFSTSLMLVWRSAINIFAIYADDTIPFYRLIRVSCFMHAHFASNLLFKRLFRIIRSFLFHQCLVLP